MVPPKRHPPGFEELIRIVQGLRRPNRVLNLRGVPLGGRTFGGVLL